MPGGYFLDIHGDKTVDTDRATQVGRLSKWPWVKTYVLPTKEGKSWCRPGSVTPTKSGRDSSRPRSGYVSRAGLGRRNRTVMSVCSLSPSFLSREVLLSDPEFLSS